MQNAFQGTSAIEGRTPVSEACGKDDGPGGKYAAEAFGVFRLFARLGRTLYGLVLLEIAPEPTSERVPAFTRVFPL